MVRAFGYSIDTLNSATPSRLCRGRERWLTGLPECPEQTLFRTVFSGAQFTDDSARDAYRGFRYGGVGAAAMLEALFPGAEVHAFCNAGDPLALPAQLTLEEDWVLPLHGGLRSRPVVRWLARVRGAEIDEVILGEDDQGQARPRAELLLITRGGVSEALIEACYHLSGFADATQSPAELYAASALPEALAHAEAVVLLHLDKHGPAVAIYTTDELDCVETIQRVARESGAFAVPFAIPPMLARWDRALYELRLDWDTERWGEFPVPPADDAGGRWSARSRRIGTNPGDEPGSPDQPDGSDADEE